MNSRTHLGPGCRLESVRQGLVRQICLSALDDIAVFNNTVAGVGGPGLVKTELEHSASRGHGLCGAYSAGKLLDTQVASHSL